MTKRKVEPVSFNLDDPFEKRLHEHAKAHTFSTYVKRLIQRDMEGGQPATNLVARQGQEMIERKAAEIQQEPAVSVPAAQHQESQPNDEDDVSGFV